MGSSYLLEKGKYDRWGTSFVPKIFSLLEREKERERRERDWERDLKPTWPHVKACSLYVSGCLLFSSALVWHIFFYSFGITVLRCIILIELYFFLTIPSGSFWFLKGDFNSFTPTRSLDLLLPLFFHFTMLSHLSPSHRQTEYSVCSLCPTVVW